MGVGVGEEELQFVLSPLTDSPEATKSPRCTLRTILTASMLAEVMPFPPSLSMAREVMEPPPPPPLLLLLLLLLEEGELYL